MELVSKKFLTDNLKSVLCSGVIGFTLGFLYLLINSSLIPPSFLKSFLLIFDVILAFFLLLSWPGISKLRLLLTSTVLAGFFSLVIAYQPASPPAHHGYGEVFLVFFLPLCATYIVNIFHQVYHTTGRFTFPYPQLFRYAWNTIFVLFLAALFTLLCWIVLWTWGYLFTIIGILFFKTLFANHLFVFLVTPTLFGMGIAIIRQYENLINALRQITIAVFLALLPVLAVIGLAFIIGLVVKMGMAVFTKTPPFIPPSANFILLTASLLAIIFLNAVFQDGEQKPPYSKGLRWLITGFIFLLPILLIFAIYIQYLDIKMKSFSPDAFQTALQTLILSLYIFSYSAVSLLSSRGWMGFLPRVNVILAGIVVAIAVIVHSPLLPKFVDWIFR